MKNRIKQVIAATVAKAAYREAERNVNSLCIFWTHQPEVPDSVKKLKK